MGARDARACDHRNGGGAGNDQTNAQWYHAGSREASRRRRGGAGSDQKGNVYFTDQPNDRILKWSTDGKLSTFLKPCGRSNGLCFDAQGNLWACADEKNELWRINPAGEVTVVVKDYKDKLLNGPNDVWIR